MEPTEVREFVEQMEDAGEAGQQTRTALAISVLAVLVALVTVLGHRTHTEAVLEQARATDSWNEYQARKIRADNLQVVVDGMGLQGTLSPAAMAKRAEYQAHLQRWADELKETQGKAREHEAEVNLAERRAGRYDLGEALLQIGVVLASITLLTRKRAYFGLGLGMALLGAVAAVAAVLVR